MKTILVTGGAGFIGHHVVEYYLQNTDYHICILDSLSYASRGLNRIRDINAYDDSRFSFFGYNMTQRMSIGMRQEIQKLNVEYIIHLAAETHVDNSITNPKKFVMANVVGTMHLLEFARDISSLKGFLYFSTDEVFGPAPTGVSYKEWDRYNSTNPYSASKAGAEELVLAWGNTYKLPVAITHTMNAFGERQHPEKFIPMTIKNVLEENIVTIHADETKTIAGSRFYIHCRNIASAVDFILRKSKFDRDKYNIVGEKEVSNLALAQIIAEIMDKPLHYEMVDFHSSRPGHDLRYALDGSKMKALGWNVPVTFEDSLRRTILWTLKRKDQWLK
jgi:dTDP-glucose 4,6-dehydratase